ncbi:hypothetical protein C6P40_004897 [Pichia californica]|uniref:CRAL-TRIO domain-containing protein n=1 Tax=Pichia californica TaxID=460514 RepID=A0A9P6WM92_9ASCO|nr:hypothetical protein C6P42_000266 [[Candida] californica]KAG0689519.1 hypothetical protein C6P40_004897 [[Candida] californica]
MTNSQIPKGRVETLSDDQEHVLKQVWMYMLHFQGYNIKPPGPLVKPGSSVRSTSTHDSVVSEEKKEKKKGGLFGKLRRNKGSEDSTISNHRRTQSQEAKLARTLSHQSAIDPNVKHTTDLKVHSALRNMDPKETGEGFWNALRHDSPDNFMLRFIRARKWDVDNSLVMLSNSIEWRVKTSDVDSLLRASELGCLTKKQEGVLKQFRSGKCIIRGKDKQNRPIVIVRPRFHHSSEQSMEEVEIFTLLMIEYARLMLTEPIDQCALIFDLKGFTMANMDYEPVKYMIGAFEAHYPESLGILLIHRAPWIFGGIWAIVKNWLDPVVASKINFTKHESDLEKYIDSREILEEMGGKDNHDYKYLEPTKQDNGLAIVDNSVITSAQTQRESLKKQFIEKTIEWIESTDMATSKKLLKERITIGRQLGENYKTFDGCVRNRGLYDRLGDITFN